MTKPTNWYVCPAKTQIWDSDQFRLTQSEQSSLCTQGSFMWTAKTDQTGRMPRLIWVFKGCTDDFVGFVVLRLIYYIGKEQKHACTFAQSHLILYCSHSQYEPCHKKTWGARWLSGRVSDSGARGRGFETYRRHAVSLSKTLYFPKVLVKFPRKRWLRPDMTEKLLTGTLSRNTNKQTKKPIFGVSNQVRLKLACSATEAS